MFTVDLITYHQSFHPTPWFVERRRAVADVSSMYVCLSTETVSSKDCDGSTPAAADMC